MSRSVEEGSAMKALLDGDDVRDVLKSTFYKSPAKPTSRPKKEKPTHYEVVCISLYTDDLARLDEKVSALKTKGHRKMSRSALIRYALDTVDLEGLPRAY